MEIHEYSRKNAFRNESRNYDRQLRMDLRKRDCARCSKAENGSERSVDACELGNQRDDRGTALAPYLEQERAAR